MVLGIGSESLSELNNYMAKREGRTCEPKSRTQHYLVSGKKSTVWSLKKYETKICHQSMSNATKPVRL